MAVSGASACFRERLSVWRERLFKGVACHCQATYLAFLFFLRAPCGKARKTGKTVIGKIAGRHPVKRRSTALSSLPRTNPPGAIHAPAASACSGHRVFEKKCKFGENPLAIFLLSAYFTHHQHGRAISSVGRAPRLHRGCREFEPLIAHHPLFRALFSHHKFLNLSHRRFSLLKVRHSCS